MKPSKNRKCREKTTSLKTQVKSQISRSRQTVLKCYERGTTAMGAGNSHDLTYFPSQEGNALSKTIMDIIMNTSGSLKDSKWPDPQNTVNTAHCHLVVIAPMNQQVEFINGHLSYFLPQCPVCFSSLRLYTSALLQCTQCPTAPFLCGSCLYPCSTDSATCTNTMCPLVSTLLTCGVVSDPKSNVFGCPEFRACPKCRNLIMHISGCKFVSCHSCKHRFCFICLQDDCFNDVAKYWSLTCEKPRARRQRFILTS